MYYYLDKDDGYSKGPYQLDDLLRLPLAPDTYIFNRANREWQKWAGLQRQIGAQSAASVRPAPRPAQPQVAEPAWQNRQAPAPRAEPKPARQKKAQAPPLPEMPRPRPQVMPMPGKPAPPAMGLSGVGCFVVALLFALLLGLLLFFS